MLNIMLKTGPREEPFAVSVDEGTTLEALYKKYKDSLENTVLLARVNNEYKGLTEPLTKDCDVELLDVRTHAANLVYQATLSLVYLAAIRNVMGDVQVEINNSLNQGLFTQIKGNPDLDDAIVSSIETEMRRIVEADLPVTREYLTLDEAKFILEGSREYAAKELEYLSHSSVIRFHALDGYRDCFLGTVAPSAGYVPHFELRKYQRGILVRFPLTVEPNKIPEYREQKNLYKTFAEQTMWGRILDVDYVADLNAQIKAGKYPELMMVSEALHEKKIAEISDMIKEQKKRIILIAGPSSSGKTTFARRLCIQLRVNGMEPLYMGTDDYFVEREETPLDENGEPNYEGLSAIDIDLFNQNMNALLAGEEVDLPTFDFITGHKEYGKRITQIKSHQPIVIEGIHGLNEKMTEQISKDDKFKIYISPLTQQNLDEHTRIPTTDERLLRRMVRDNQFRNHPPQGTLLEWPKVRKGEDENIFPYSEEADVVFNSFHIYEIAVLKKYAEPLLEAIPPEDKAYAEAQRILQALQFFVKIEDDSMIVNNSIIREFIGGSVLSH